MKKNLVEAEGLDKCKLLLSEKPLSSIFMITEQQADDGLVSCYRDGDIREIGMNLVNLMRKDAKLYSIVESAVKTVEYSFRIQKHNEADAQFAEVIKAIRSELDLDKEHAKSGD